MFQILLFWQSESSIKNCMSVNKELCMVFESTLAAILTFGPFSDD